MPIPRIRCNDYKVLTDDQIRRVHRYVDEKLKAELDKLAIAQQEAVRARGATRA